jgi:multisubunit Na+/H+ antiporter MnhE subunit
MTLLFGTVALLFIWIFLYLCRYGVFITKYTGATAALASGMMTGFVASVSFSMLEGVQDEKSTIMGLILSMLTGMIVGVPHSFAAWFAGGCGGLVSAPLGTAVASLLVSDRGESYITVLLMVCTFFLLWLLGMITAEIPYYYPVAFRKLVLNPLIVGIPLILIFYVYEFLERSLFYSRKKQTTRHRKGDGLFVGK